jgi:ligand-binding sensor domain-containing protein
MLALCGSRPPARPCVGRMLHERCPTVTRSLASFSAHCGLLLLLISVCGVHAERLPSTFFTPSDGLPHRDIRRILTDSRGFVWFCTRRGLSRFDGQRCSLAGTARLRASIAIPTAMDCRHSDGLLRSARIAQAASGSASGAVVSRVPPWNLHAVHVSRWCAARIDWIDLW